MSDRTVIKGRWALVTGATSGFGLAIARAIAAEGCHVAITGRHLSLAGASAGPFTATITIGDLTLEASGTLRTTGAKLVYP